MEQLDPRAASPGQRVTGVPQDCGALRGGSGLVLDVGGDQDQALLQRDP